MCAHCLINLEKKNKPLHKKTDFEHDLVYDCNEIKKNKTLINKKKNYKVCSESNPIPDIT